MTDLVLTSLLTSVPTTLQMPPRTGAHGRHGNILFPIKHSAPLRPKPGDCCVFCSYGTVKCPPIQQQRGCCQ